MLAACSRPPPPPAPAASTEAPKPGRRSCSALVAQRAAEESADAAPSAADAGGPLLDADKTIAALRPKFRACYQRGLKGDPKMEGCVVLRAKVAAEGGVASSEVYVSDGLSPEVADCLALAVGSAQFSAPGGQGSTLDVPVTFVQQR